jgi:hypothetical protein
LNPRSQQAWMAMASYHHFARDLAALRHAVDRVVALNPLHTDLVARPLSTSTWPATWRAAMARKPTYPGWYHFPIFDWHFTRGWFEEALQAAKAISLPNVPTPDLGAASAAGHLGRAADARAALKALRAIDPALAEPETAGQVWARWHWSEERVAQSSTASAKPCSSTRSDNFARPPRTGASRRPVVALHPVRVIWYFGASRSARAAARHRAQN